MRLLALGGRSTRDGAVAGADLLRVLALLPRLHAVQLVDVRVAQPGALEPVRAEIQHLRISFWSQASARSGNVELKHALGALGLFRAVDVLHLGPFFNFLTCETGSAMVIPDGVAVRALFLRNPWPMRATLSALLVSPQLGLKALNVGAKTK
ncbi:hypothetical protein PsYK624_146640 [Phanerochaete sordida]|uniref:Uncharacterized protein n=1 Tax=Phanerochaete sordida TaxID=48140 RepID=A0A9P3GS78_9APHY|nr:hypothetical protein PsYK624_146640 [Phanerochaete sordida]